MAAVRRQAHWPPAGPGQCPLDRCGIVTELGTSGPWCTFTRTARPSSWSSQRSTATRLLLRQLRLLTFALSAGARSPTPASWRFGHDTKYELQPESTSSDLPEGDTKRVAPPLPRSIESMSSVFRLQILHSSPVRRTLREQTWAIFKAATDRSDRPRHPVRTRA